MMNLYPRVIPKTSYKNYLSKWHSLNLVLDLKINNGADWHHIGQFYSLKPNQMIILENDKYHLGRKGILIRELKIYDNKQRYYVASYARAMFEILHEIDLLRIKDITELMFEKSVLKELKSYFLLHNCDLCKEYLEKESLWF